MTTQSARSDAIDLEARYMMQTYKRLPVTFAMGEGCYLYDTDGRVPHSLLLELFTNAGQGTKIRPAR